MEEGSGRSGEYSTKHEHEANSHEHAEHSHEHEGVMAHGHVHPHSKQVANRLAKAAGHLQSVKKMVENGRDCSEVLI